MEKKKDSGLEEKKQKVLAGALSAFIQYGYKRVTMSDIASEAGLSRPALYLLYENKEDIFCAVALQYANQSRAQVQAGLAQTNDVIKQLQLFLDVYFLETFKFIHKSPHADELINCTHDFAAEAMDHLAKDQESLLAEILHDHQDKFDDAIKRKDFIHFFRLSASGFKMQASSVKELKALLATLMTLAKGLLE